MLTRHRQQGMTIVFAGVFLVALIGITSLAVDWGRVQTARNEIQDAADAAARYAVSGILDNTYLAKAQAAAFQNKVDGSYLAITSADVDVGTWDSVLRKFTVGGSNRNAVRVYGRRIAARGNAVPLYFARAVNRPTYDLIVISIATLDVTPYSMVALNSIAMSGTSKIQRMASETGSGTVAVASNGTWALGSSSAISGDALYRTTAPTGNTISGAKTAMSANIAYPNVATPPSATYVGPFSATSGSFPVGGDYSVTQCTVGGTFAISLTADTNMYCSGNVSFGGNTQVNTNGFKFTIYMTGSGTIAMTNALPVSVVIYGPNSAMTVNSAGKITGSFVCKSLAMSAGTIEYTSALPIPLAPTSGGAATVSTGIQTVAEVPN